MARFDLAWLARTAREGVQAGTAVEDLSLAGSPYPGRACSRSPEPRLLGVSKFSQ